jgi:6-pyruvoyl-tetrahydropterin synthase
MHDHGHTYRAKIVSTDGRTEYGEWFNTEKELRDAMQGVTRAIGKRYYCEAKKAQCTEPGCDVDPTPRVIAAL